MSTIIEAFQNHPVHSALDSLFKAIEEKESADIPTDQQPFLERISAVAKYIQFVLRNTDPLLVFELTLNNLHQEVTAVCNCVTSGQLVQIAGHYNTIILNIAHIPLLKTLDGTEVFYSRLEDFIAKSEMQLSQMQGKRETFAEEIGELRKKCVALQKRNTSIDEELNNLKSRADTVISDFQQKYLDGSEKRNTEFLALIESFRQDVERFKESFKLAFDALEQGLSGQAKSTLDKIDAQNHKAAEIVGIIAQTSTMGHYDRVANREWWASEIMRYVAIVSIILVSGSIVWAFWGVTQQNMQWEAALVFRVSLGLPFIGLAVYCARESSRHRTNEMRNRQMAMELATVGPYLNALPKEKKESLLEKFAEKYFGRKNDDTDVELLSASQWIPLKGISTNRFLKLIEYIAKIVRP